MKEILFITGNKHKLREAREILPHCQINNIEIDLPEIQAIDVKKVVKEKAIIAYNKIKKPLIVEDTGLHIEEWDNFPGALSKWLETTAGNDKIVKMLTPFKNKKAYAETAICYYDGKICKIFSGQVHGKIVNPRGTNGFGWAPIFEVPETNKTFAEMTEEEKAPYSMRRKAFDKMAKIMNL